MKTLTYSDTAPQRLDKFLLAEIQGLTFPLLQKYWRQNKVKLNGKKAPLSTRVQPGDEVRLYLPQDFAAAPAPPAVLFEDENLLALYKPAGLISLVQGDKKQDSLQRRATQYLQEQATGASALLCHRLDTGTSGVLLAAKNPDARDFVVGLIREHQLQKIYYGLVLGHLHPTSGTLDAPLLKDADKGFVRAVAKDTPGAKPAETGYETLAANNELALLRLSPRTGRTHQLRAHLAGAGAPLLGDSKYGNNTANRQHRCRYQCLCAAKVRFPVLSGAWAAYSGLAVTCEKPWFFVQAMEGRFP